MAKTLPRSRHIPGYGRYEVTDDGQVISHVFKKSRVMKLSKQWVGYLMVGIWPDDPEDSSDLRQCLVHRLVAELFVKNPDPKTHTDVIHLDFNRTNNHCKNLAWVTEAAVRERQDPHSRNGGRRSGIKLTQVPEIRQKAKDGVSRRELMGQYRLSYEVISNVITGKSWKFA